MKKQKLRRNRQSKHRFMKGVEVIPNDIDRSRLEILKDKVDSLFKHSSENRNDIAIYNFRKDESVYNRMIFSLYSLGMNMFSEKKNNGFKDEEEFLSICNTLDFLKMLCNLLESEKSFLGEDLDEWSSEWFIMQMIIRFGVEEEELKKKMSYILEECIMRRIGILDIGKPLEASNCIVSLLEVF